MRRRVVLSAFIILSIFTTMFLGVPVNRASAAPVEDIYWTWAPDAASSSFYRWSPNPTTPVPSYGAQVIVDDYNQHITYSQDAEYVLMCSDFSNESFSEEYATMPENATILEVWLLANFWTYRPAMSLRLTVDGITNSTSVSAGYGAAYLNVTHMREWTYEMIVNASTIVWFFADTVAGQSYYVDYLGFEFIKWQGWHEPIEYEDPEEEEADFPDIGYDIVYTGEGLIGVLAVIGFLGMIAVPAAGIWLMKNGYEGRMVTFVKMLIVWTFCLSLFMLAVNTE